MRLTPDALADAHALMRLIKGIQGEAHRRVEYAHSPQFGDTLSETDQLAYVTVTSSLLNVLNDEVNKLAAILDVDLEGGSVDEKLAHVIELFDGNRRQHRS